MAEGIAFSIVGKLAEYTVDPVLRQIKYSFFYNSNIQNLQNKVQELENKRNDVRLLVGAAERNTEIIRKEVSAWLDNVDKFLREAESSETRSEMRCLFNRSPNLKSRYLLSRRATKKTIEANDLVDIKFERVSSRPLPVQELNLTPHVDFETRLSTEKKIKEALKHKDIGIIGICGMPGVGKTTMARKIENEVKNEKLFEEVAYAVVSNDPDIKKIQDELADMLGLTIEEKTNKDARARRLHDRLKGNNDKSILVVLDDVWEEIDLGTIGIPSPHDRLKIMFTTRIEETCRKMKAQTFEIEVLPEEEEWQLFKDTAEISDDETDVVSIAKRVARECRGLPLALVVVGKALKKKAPYKWTDALKQLQNSRVTNLDGMHNLVYSRIELSYKFLESDEDRDLLLLCSLFAEDECIPIENLVRYARGLELFPDTETLSETQNRAHSIADNLKSCNLLQQCMKKDEVKLHDVIRDFCLQMAKKEKGGYLVNHAGLKEWPEHDAPESCSAISITFDELDQLPSGLKYRNVKLLRVICRELGECNISEEFFKDMKDLRVLELKGMYIQIPSSIQLLTGLRTLCLIGCRIHSQLSMIGSLKTLEILSFYQSFVDYFPIELANLSNLRSLDLRFQESSCPLRPGVLSGMKKLEELYLGGSIPIEGEDRRYIIEELSSLTSLHTFEICTPNPILMQILKARCLENLEKFEIKTSSLSWTGNQYFTRSLSLRDSIEASMLLQPVCNSLMKKTYHLHIQFAKALKNVVSELDGDGFIKLKTLILSSGDFEYLIDATNSIPNGTFGKLESLKLEELPKLIEICNGNLPRGVIKPQLFCNLVSVEMHSCDTIRSLFRESVANGLVNLQNLDISYCEMLEEVVSTDARENEVTKMLEFPKLKEVRLDVLRRFKSFTSQSNSGVAHQTLFNQVNFPNMESLHVNGLGCIVKLLGKETSLPKLKDIWVSHFAELLTIAESDSIQLLQNLGNLELYHCNAVEVLFDFEGINVTNDDAEINMLGRLTSLWLSSLPKLVHITRMVPKGIRVFQKLTDLTVKDCKSLRSLFSPSMANSLVALNTLDISYCEKLEEVVSTDARENDVTETCKMLEFPKLKEVRLTGLSSFKSFASQSNGGVAHQTLFNQNQVTFPNMEELNVRNLDCIVKLLGKETPMTSLPKLKDIQVLSCDKLLTIAESDSIQSLQNLERLTMLKCNALEVLFDFEGIKITNDDAEINMLGRLTSLQLDSLPKLVHLTRMVPKRIRVFQKLTDLTVAGCKSLRSLFSPSMANSLVALDFLMVSNCGSIKKIIEKEEQEQEEEGNIVFPNMKRLRLEDLSSIQMFCFQELEFPSLEDLTIKRCPKMKNLSARPPSAPKLSEQTRQRYEYLFRPLNITCLKRVIAGHKF